MIARDKRIGRQRSTERERDTHTHGGSVWRVPGRHVTAAATGARSRAGRPPACTRRPTTHRAVQRDRGRAGPGRASQRTGVVRRLITVLPTDRPTRRSSEAPAARRQPSQAEIPRQQFPRDILAHTPHTRDIIARMLRGCRACRATSPFSLPRALI